MAHDVGVATIAWRHIRLKQTFPEQHITAARKLGMDTVGFLMMAHMASPEKLLEEAQKMVFTGANCIYVTDSAGYMLPQDVTDRVGILRANLGSDIEIGFHGHHNLGMGVANSVSAVTAGATRVDSASAGLGAGAGNTPLELFVAVANRTANGNRCGLV